jgi:hypothetical protein
MSLIKDLYQIQLIILENDQFKDFKFFLKRIVTTSIIKLR